MKKIISFLVILVFIFVGISMNVEATEDNFFSYDTNQTEKEYSINEAQLYFESYIYNTESRIDLTIYENFSEKIIDYKIECFGFEIITEFTIQTESIDLSLGYINNHEKAFFNMRIFLDDLTEFEFNVYGIKKDEKIFLSKLSYNDAENTYMDYLYQNDLEKYNLIRSELMPCYDPILPVSSIQNTPAYILSGTPNTYVEGTLKWQDEDGNKDEEERSEDKKHPLQYVLVELWDKQPNGERKLSSTYTDKNGYYQFAFKNADQPSDNENGGYDVFVRVIAAGENVKVCNANGSIYYEDIGYHQDIKTGFILEISHIFEMKAYDTTIEKSVDQSTSQALQISQAVIYATKYVKEMRGSYIAPTTVKFPHNQTSSVSNWFDFDTRTIFLGATSDKIYPIYSLWDVIMHEYGHHIQMGFGFEDGPGNNHYDVRMADHYNKHFVGFSPEDYKTDNNENPQCTGCAAACNYVKERDCKIQGNKIAWEECFPTYFSIVAQQYFAEDLKNIPTVGDTTYTSLRGWGYSLTGKRRLGEDNEGTIQSILYEMYDNSNNDASIDGLSLGHKAMWDLLINSKATTFQEFDTYFRNTHSNKEDLIAYGRILSYYKLAPTIAIPDQMSINGVTFKWSYEPEKDSKFYNNYTYQLNFYDLNMNLICKTDIINDTSLILDEYLWADILSTGAYFYVSVTRFENSYPATSYEGERVKYPRPDVTILNYTSIITKTIETGECHWYSFTSLQTATYEFKTYGDMDTYGELFPNIVVGQSTYGRLTYEDDIDDEDHNFAIPYTVNKGETIFIRVRGFNWTSTGEYTIYMYSLDHQHEYMHSYTQIDSIFHYSTCFCGRSIKEYHSFQVERPGYRCISCKYYTTGPIPELLKFDNEDKEVIYFEKKNILEEITS